MSDDCEERQLGLGRGGKPLNVRSDVQWFREEKPGSTVTGKHEDRDGHLQCRRMSIIFVRVGVRAPRKEIDGGGRVRGSQKRDAPRRRKGRTDECGKGEADSHWDVLIR